MKKALVTGGGGFVGSAIVKRLIAMGVQPVVLGRNAYPELERLNVEIICGDIRNPEVVRAASKDCDTVFHVAAKAGVWGKRQEYYSINCLGTENVLAACRKNTIANLVYTSTPSVVFDDANIENGNESLSYSRRPRCYYAETKIIAERSVLSANSEQLHTVSLRPHLIWGPGDTNLIPRLVSRGLKGLLKQVGNGTNMVDISFIDNVVDAHIQAALSLESSDRASGKAYFISQGAPVNLWQWVNELFEQLAIPTVQKKISFRSAYVVGALLECIFALCRLKEEPLMTRFVAQQLSKSHWFSINAARNDLDFEPRVATDEGVKRLVEWVREQEWYLQSV